MQPSHAFDRLRELERSVIHDKKTITHSFYDDRKGCRTLLKKNDRFMVKTEVYPTIDHPTTSILNIQEGWIVSATYNPEEDAMMLSYEDITEEGFIQW